MISIVRRTSLRFLLLVLAMSGFAVLGQASVIAEESPVLLARDDIPSSLSFWEASSTDSDEKALPAPSQVADRQSLQEFSERVFLPFVSTEPIAIDETFISHASPVFINDIQGRVYTDGRMPPNLACVHTYELGSNGRDPATWRVGDFTGFYPAGTVQASQRSLNADTYGDSAVQMQGFDVGFHLQSKPPSADFPWQLSQYYYGFAPEIFPWAFGQNARFCIDHDAAVPVSAAEGEAVNYAYVAFAADEKFSGETIWVSMSHFDDRQHLIDRGDFAHWWAEANDPIAYGFYGGDRYSSLLPGSATSTSEPWDEWRQFGFCMSYSQMQTILQDINNDFQLGISEHPENYGIRLFGIGPEMYITEDSQSYMSMRIRDVHAFTLNSRDGIQKWDRPTIRRAERSSVAQTQSP